MRLRPPPFAVAAAALLCVAALAGCSASSRSGEPAKSGEADAPPGAGGDPFTDAAPPTGELLGTEVATVGWDELSGSPVVLLRELEGGEVLPIWIGINEARAITMELHGVTPPRPLTHDLMANLLRALDAELEEVVVHSLREGVYYGLLKLRVAGREAPRWVDARPSDAIALALRAAAPISVAKELVATLPELRFRAPEASDQVVQALGLTVVAVDEVWRRELSLPDRPGIVVLAAAGEAARRGLRRGDFIVRIAGEPATTPLDLLSAIAAAPSGGTLEVTWWRDGEELTAELDLAVPDRPTTEQVV